MNHRVKVCLTMALAVLPQAVAAQENRTVAPPIFTVGARLRLSWSENPKPLEGVVVGMDEDVITLAPPGGAPLKLPKSSVTRAELSVGHHRNWLKGLAIGAASGLLLGLVVPVDSSACGTEEQYLCSRGEAVSFLLLGGGMTGTLIGGLTKSERWVPVSVRPGPAAGASRSGGLKFALTVRF